MEKERENKNVVNLGQIRPNVVRYRINEVDFDIPTRYSPIKVIGQGSYGVVCSAIDREENEMVAVKKILLKSNEVQLKRTLREIKLLSHFDNENILGLRDIFPPPPNEPTPDEVYIVTELMDTDLHQIISLGELSDDHLQLILFQILRGLKYIHSANVIHRDIKPGNVFINRDCFLKIADFGLARAFDSTSNELFMTDYVATRWYRAPEVILSWKQYTKSIDVWATGCVFAELMLRKPLFPGKDYVNQIAVICSVMGTPSEADTNNIQSDHAKKYIKSLGAIPKTPLSKLLPKANPLALDLLDKMLAFNPEKRYTVDQCLSHPYLAFFKKHSDELVSCEYGVFDFGFEQNFCLPLTKEMYYEMINQEMFSFHPEQNPEHKTESQSQPEQYSNNSNNNQNNDAMQEDAGVENQGNTTTQGGLSNYNPTGMITSSFTEADIDDVIASLDQDDMFKNYFQ